MPCIEVPAQDDGGICIVFQFTCYLVETSVQCFELVDRAARWPIKGAYVNSSAGAYGAELCTASVLPRTLTLPVRG